MRLGQLARKLAVKQSELVDFLAQKNIQIENGGNTKIEEAHLTLLIEEFAPEGLELAGTESPEPELIESVAAKPADAIIEIPAPAATNESSDETSEQKIELIKAPKVELSGLKVLGKIELPEPKKKDPVVESSEPAERIERKPRRDRDQFRKERNPSRSAKNPIVAERERQAREAENKKQEQAALEKERKTLRYMKKMNATQPTKAVRTFHEPEEAPQAAPPPAPAPKTAWGRFMRWLNT